MGFKYKLIPIILFFFILSGCYSVNTKDLESAYYGSYPKNYKEIVADYMSLSLKDPESVRYKFIEPPEKTYINNISYKEFGYGMCVYINAKNSYGGYVGNTMYFFLIRDGRVIISEGEMERDESTVPPGLGLCSQMMSHRKDMEKISNKYDNSLTSLAIKNPIDDNDKKNKYLDNFDKVSSQLRKLKELKDIGIINKNEYEEKRKVLVDKLNFN